MDINSLRGWYPIAFNPSCTQVKWVNLENKLFTKPFFHDELNRVSRSRYRHLTIDSLAAFEHQHSLPPAAFIFHLSRCGSTLMTQQLMQLSRCLVLSEPPIIESVLSATRLHFRDKRIKWLRAAISALGQPQNALQSHLIIKLDCWHIADLPDIQQAFPNTPCFLLYRDAAPIFASHQRQMGTQMIPGLVDTTGLPIKTDNIHYSDLSGYTLEILKGLFTSALEQAQRGTVYLIHYDQLPEFTSGQFSDAIQQKLTSLEKQAIQKRALRHSKQQNQSFKPDQALQNTSINQTKLDYLHEIYLKLELLRVNNIQPTYQKTESARSTPFMTDAFHQLPLTFDTQRLKQDLDKLINQNWLTHINRHVHDGGWASLPLRSVDGKIDNTTVTETAPEHYRSTCYLEQSDYLKEVLESLQCTLVSARLMRLKAGQTIRRHTDMDLCFEDGYARLHIPIQTHSDVRFLINDHPIHFAAGECWYMNANYPHQVTNNSHIDRIHLVVDCVVNDWLKALFLNSGYHPTIVEHKYGSPSITDDNVQQVIEQIGGGNRLKNG